MRRFDASRARSMRGFRKVVPFDDGIIVVATNTWYAMRAAQSIDVEWDEAPYPGTDAEHREAVEAAIDTTEERTWRDDGDVDEALSGSGVIEGTYHVPYLAHATMEPLNAVALFKGGELELWAGHQNPSGAQQIGALFAGVSRESVRVHTTYMGGGFGRRLERDFVRIAVQAACAMPGTPVNVTWPREEDMTHDVYRPLATARFPASAALRVRLSRGPDGGSAHLHGGG